MTFSDIFNGIADQFQDTSAAMITRIKRYVNFSQQDIASRSNWDFLMESGSIQCVAPYETGTVTVTDGDATVTGSGTTFTSAMVGRKIRFDSQSAYYTISAYTSATEIELTKNYNGTTTADVEYSVYQDVYDLSTGDKLINLTNTDKQFKLSALTRNGFDGQFASPTSTGSPEFWIPAGRTAAGLISVQLYPIPDDTYVINYWIRKNLTDLSADADVSEIPSKYHKLLYLGGLAQAYEYDENPLANNMWTQYENMLSDMESDYGSGAEDSVPVLRSYDEKMGSDINKLRLPPEHFRN